MRVILDANVLIAAVAGRGLCESILELCLEEHDLIVSRELIEEVRRNLVKRIRLPESVASEFCSLIQKNAIMAVPWEISPGACRDPKDVYLLGLSEAGKAEFIVTGDKDLTSAEWAGSVKIVTPRQFWEICRRE